MCKEVGTAIWKQIKRVMVLLLITSNIKLLWSLEVFSDETKPRVIEPYIAAVKKMHETVQNINLW